MALGVQQQVGRLDVAVEDALPVSVFESLGHLHAEPRDAAKVSGLGREVGPDQRSSWSGPPDDARRRVPTWCEVRKKVAA